MESRNRRTSFAAVTEFIEDSPPESFVEVTEWNNSLGCTINVYSPTLGDRLLNVSWAELETVYQVAKVVMEPDKTDDTSP